MSATELKRLQTRVGELKQALKEEEEKEKEIQKKKTALRSQIKRMQKKIDGLTERGIVVSEHAVLRYLERVRGVDMDEIREKILSPIVKGMIDTVGNGKFPQNGDEKGKYRVVVRGRVVTTIEE